MNSVTQIRPESEGFTSNLEKIFQSIDALRMDTVMLEGIIPPRSELDLFVHDAELLEYLAEFPVNSELIIAKKTKTAQSCIQDLTDILDSFGKNMKRITRKSVTFTRERLKQASKQRVALCHVEERRPSLSYRLRVGGLAFQHANLLLALRKADLHTKKNDKIKHMRHAASAVGAFQRSTCVCLLLYFF
jgi:hypothetical protein